MATLHTLTNITRDTIADGDKLNDVILDLSANDAAMLAETQSTYSTTQDVFNTVKNTSGVKWNNNLVKNFSKIVVNNDKTLTGKSKLGSTVTFTDSDTIKIEKDGNVYKFTASDSIANVSSYFKYAKWSYEIPVSRESVDPFIAECSTISLHSGSIALYDSYINAAGAHGEYGTLDGFSKSRLAETSYTNYANILSGDRLSSLVYSATTNVYDHSVFPLLANSVVAHTIPTRGSFYVHDYFSSLDSSLSDEDAYVGATIVDNGSIGIWNKVFAKNFSIGFKGCSAEDYSVCLFGGLDRSGYVLNNIAKTSSYVIGTNGIALNKSFIVTNSVDSMTNNTPSNITAKNCSMMLYVNTACTANVQNSAMLLLPTTEDSNCNFNVDGSIAFNCHGRKSISKNRTLLLAGFPDHNSYTREFDHSIVAVNDISYVKNAVSMYVKGAYKAANAINNAVAIGVNFNKELVVKNSLLISTTYYGPESMPAIPLYVSHSATDSIEIATELKTTSAYPNIAYDQSIVLPAGTYNNKHHVLILDTEADQCIRTSSYADCANSIFMMPGVRTNNNNDEHDYNWYYNSKCKRLGEGNIFIKGSVRDATTAHNSKIEHNLLIGYDQVDVSFACSNNTMYNAKTMRDTTNSFIYYASADAYQYYGQSRIQSNEISMYFSNCRACKSMAYNHSYVNIPQVVHGAGPVEICTDNNYCLSLFHSTATITYSGDTAGQNVGIFDDKKRLALWNNKLTLENLPTTQFERIASIDDFDALSTDIYYVIG